MSKKHVNRGRLTVHYGSMFSGKTDSLVGLYRILTKYGRKKVAVFMPSRDTRRVKDAVESLDGQKAPAKTITDPTEIIDLVLDGQGRPKVDVVLLDEVQFWQDRASWNRVDDWMIVFVVQILLRAGIDVFAFGLNTNFLTHPFPPTTDLMGFADDLIRHRACCDKCGEPADWSLRLRGGQPVGPEGELIVVAGTTGEEGSGGETYTAVCARHHPYI